LEDYGEQASVLDGMKKPAEWLTPRFLPRGVIRIVFPAGAEEGGCDGDCCCGDSDSEDGSEGGESDDYDDSDEE
jgi:hypothetical protein